MRWTRLSFLMISMMVALAIAAVACAEEPEPREPTPVFDPTPAPKGAEEASPTPAGEATPAGEPTSTEAPAAPSADPANGESVFRANGCNACHSTGDDTLVGPGLAGLSGRASERVPELSAEEYIRESIVDPSAHVVEGFNDLMPKNFADQISEDDLNDLVAYLETLE